MNVRLQLRIPHLLLLLRQTHHSAQFQCIGRQPDLSVGQDAQAPQLEETTEQDGPHKCVQEGKQWLEVCGVLNVYV